MGGAKSGCIIIIIREENEKLKGREMDQFAFERMLHKAGESDGASYQPCRAVRIIIIIIIINYYYYY